MVSLAEKQETKTGWTPVKFGDVVRQVKDKVDPDTSGLERYIAGEHMDTDDLRIRRWGEIGADYLGPAFHMRFKPGQVLYGSRRTYLRKVAVPDFEGICANTTFVLESKDPNVLLPELLPFIMRTEGFHEHSVKQSKGSVNPYVNFSDLAWFEFALPPMEEQKRIADVLQKANTFTSAYHYALESALQLRSSIRASEFNPNRYPPRKLASLCPEKAGIQIGPFGAQLHQSDYTKVGIPVVMPANMQDEQIDTREIAKIPEEKANQLFIHRVKPGDILLPRRGELDRRAYVNNTQDGWLCGTGSIRIRVKENISSQAVFHALASVHVVRWLNGNAVGTTMLNLNSKIVSNIPVALPPDKRLIDVLKALNELDKAIDSLRKKVLRTQQIRSLLSVTLLEES